MAHLELTLAMTSNLRTDPVLSGAVRPDGVKLQSTVAAASDIFWRQLHAQKFDVSEMSMSSLLIVIARGNRDWVGIPVFSQRHFFQTWAWVRTDAGIQSASDLKGKRMGVPEYQQTAALWSRAILEHDFGVKPSDMEWYMERTAERSHGAATGFQPPDGVRTDLYPYGVKSNRKTLETLAEYSVEQGLTPRKVDLEEVFAPSTLDV